MHGDLTYLTLTVGEEKTHIAIKHPCDCIKLPQFLLSDDVLLTNECAMINSLSFPHKLSEEMTLGGMQVTLSQTAGRSLSQGCLSW